MLAFCLLALTSATLAQSVETQPQTTQRTATLAPDTQWATPYIEIDTHQPGPVVMIVGGMHGNEPAGARAATAIARWKITRGKLVVVPRANTLGLDQRTRYVPGHDTEHRDLNRNFPKRDGTPEARSALAKSIWALVRRVDPDWLIDLHEGYDFHRINKASVGSSVIHMSDTESARAARLMLDAVNATIERDDRKLVSLSKGPIDSGMARAAIERLGAKGIILETTSKDQPLALRVRQHHIMVHTLFRDLELVDVELAELLGE
jgi:predicted deacylase